MPTAAKLFAAVVLAMASYLAAEAFKPQMPVSTQFGWFSQIVAALGAVCGWRVSGTRAGRGWLPALGVGVTSALVLVFTAAFLFAVREMVYRSLDQRYRGPMDALVGIFEIFLNYMALVLAAPSVVGIMFFGGLLCGLAAEFASRRWK